MFRGWSSSYSLTTQQPTGQYCHAHKADNLIHPVNDATCISYHSQIVDAPELKHPDISLVLTGGQCEGHTKKDAYDDNLPHTHTPTT